MIMSDLGAVGTRQQLLLLFLSGSEHLDPIRIMKGMFLFSQECPKGWIEEADRYRFQPYNWGPFSRDVYRDLDALIASGLVSTMTVTGRAWNYHTATDEGRVLAAEAGMQWNPAVSVYLQKLRQFVLSVSFSTLLKTIYQKYPDFAVNSVFRG
jgi:hypothetical protein